ncbi:zinc finger Y-chromosomal protein 2-like isoform X2 [Sitophilus oryzae]|uniref:Zinc finger Y-chromosomal protein 2-like isoform X2 n=1 Tax=Sitophilus oryzae TaxID=7048 RepID=A0A6J2YLC7_SITOR|nr:zinc finger Y-chromosomal protein 2-like isoform X2 [Sitophilus oryzae]
MSFETHDEITDIKIEEVKLENCYDTLHSPDTEYHADLSLERSEVKCLVKQEHNTSKYFCKRCYYKTKSKKKYKAHILQHLITTHNCYSCDVQFKQKFQLDHHVREMHHKTDDERFYCTKCSYKTRQRGHLTRHDLTHRISRDVIIKYACESCGARYMGKDALKRHITDVHQVLVRKTNNLSSDKKYGCNECSYKTHKKGLLYSHMDKHRKEMDLFRCNECGFESKYRKNLIKHLETHRPRELLEVYQCKICNFKSRLGSCLKRHLQSKKHLMRTGELDNYVPRTK